MGRCSSAVEQGFRKAKVGSSNLFNGTIKQKRHPLGCLFCLMVPLNRLAPEGSSQNSPVDCFARGVNEIQRVHDFVSEGKRSANLRNRLAAREPLGDRSENNLFNGTFKSLYLKIGNRSTTAIPHDFYTIRHPARSADAGTSLLLSPPQIAVGLDAA